MDLKESRWEGMDWIDLTPHRDNWFNILNMLINLRIPCNAGNFLTSLGPISFSRRTVHHGVS
jgi:hypothetical protein